MISLSSALILVVVPGILLILSGFYLRRANSQKFKNSSNEANELRAKLTISEERYKVLTDNLAASVIIRNSEGKVLYCSPFTEVLMGYSLDEIYSAPGDFFEGIVHEEDREKYRRSLKVSSFGEAFQFRYRFMHKGGIEMWAESRTVPIINDDGSITSSLSIVLDVTSTARYQKQIEEKNRDLHDFTYMVSHDLKAPIFTIKGMLAIIEEDFGAKIPNEAKEPFEHLNRAAKRLEELVQSVLEYSRASSVEAKDDVVELSGVIDEVIKDFEPQLKEISAKVNVVKPLPKITGDKLNVSQVIGNLISNSIKYRSKNTPLIIDVCSIPTPRLKTAIIEIKDNGQGIPQDKLSSIFRPFQRLHGPEIEGTGIGLACVKKLLEKMGGDVTALSDGSSGTSFHLAFRLGEH